VKKTKPAAECRLSMKVLAARISEHLHRFERDLKINARDPVYRTSPFYCAHASAAGAYVRIVYVTYQGGRNFKREDAEKYLAWLDAGNVGKHYEALEPKARKR
jgi:predicted Holliday junction resolvase-like endonuclease